MREGEIWEYTFIRGILVGIDWLVADPGDPWHGTKAWQSGGLSCTHIQEF
jgi:hypothetical protein